MYWTQYIYSYPVHPRLDPGAGGTRRRCLWLRHGAQSLHVVPSFTCRKPSLIVPFRPSSSAALQPAFSLIGICYLSMVSPIVLLVVTHPGAQRLSQLQT